MMKRREFIALVSGVVGLPRNGYAQRAELARRVGVLVPYRDTDAEYVALVGAFNSELHRLGWQDKVNCKIEYRWTAGAADRLQTHASGCPDKMPKNEGR